VASVPVLEETAASAVTLIPNPPFQKKQMGKVENIVGSKNPISAIYEYCKKGFNNFFCF